MFMFIVHVVRSSHHHVPFISPPSHVHHPATIHLFITMSSIHRSCTCLVRLEISACNQPSLAVAARRHTSKNASGSRAARVIGESRSKQCNDAITSPQYTPRSRHVLGRRLHHHARLLDDEMPIVPDSYIYTVMPLRHAFGRYCLACAAPYAPSRRRHSRRSFFQKCFTIHAHGTTASRCLVFD